MDTGVKRTQRDYTMAFKLAVVGQVEKGCVFRPIVTARSGIVTGRSGAVTSEV